MPKSSQIDKAIANLQAEINILEAAMRKLVEQSRAQKKPKAVKPRLQDAG